MVTPTSDASPWVAKELNQYLAFSLNTDLRMVDGQRRLILPVRWKPVTINPDAEESNWAKVLELFWIDGVGKSDAQIADEIAAALVVDHTSPAPEPTPIPTSMPQPVPLQPESAQQAPQSQKPQEPKPAPAPMPQPAQAKPTPQPTSLPESAPPVIALPMPSTPLAPKIPDVRSGRRPTRVVLISTLIAVLLVALSGGLYAYHAGYLTPASRLLWRYRTGAGVDSAILAVNNVIYIGGSDDYLYALNAADGSLKWKYWTGTSPKPSGFGLLSPQLADGVVNVGSDNDYAYAINASDGSLKWKYETGDQVSSAPAIVNGVVYIGSGDGYMYALNVSDGSPKWRYKTGNSVFFGSQVVGGVVYFASDDGYIYALNASDGSLK